MNNSNYLTSFQAFILLSHSSTVFFSHYLLFEHCSERQHLLLTCELCHGFHDDHSHVCCKHWTPDSHPLKAQHVTITSLLASLRGSNFYFRPVTIMLSNIICSRNTILLPQALTSHNVSSVMIFLFLVSPITLSAWAETWLEWKYVMDQISLCYSAASLSPSFSPSQIILLYAFERKGLN